MKYTIEQIKEGEDELILRYKQLTREAEEIMAFMRLPEKTLIGYDDSGQTIIEKNDILYIETVDRKTFIYTAENVLRTEYTLSQLEEILSAVNFFRCSKSMILNIDKISRLKSLASNRIDAELKNKEHIIISRTYASEFRRRIKGE
ncbi:MAG: LytTR family transcriptional regulator DNA-binding domain-containing protein [Oscillospiraceae bacterium]|nr:LytTR family transcriptional regulator DNA-binding domain-containing protein [Oscillospiraceae bacterium]